MKKFALYAFVLALLATFIQCTATKNGKEKGKPIRFKQRIGRVTKSDFQNKSRFVLQNRHQYQYERTEDSESQLYIETLWRFRTPFQDEVNSGVTEARSKIILTAYPREMTNPAGLWIATMEAWNEVKLEGSQGWVRLPLTREALAYFKRIADDLQIEFRTGLRVY